MADEAIIQRGIIAVLTQLGYRVLRHNCGTRNNRVMGLGTGTPDLYVPVKTTSGVARPVWLEVKGPDGKASPAQVEWMREANDNGEYAVVVRSIAEAVDAVKRAQKGEAA